MKKTKLFLFLCLIASFVFADDIYHSNNEYFKNNVYFTSSNRPTWNDSGLATTNEIESSTITVGTNTLSGDIILTNSGNIILSVEDNSINISAESFKQVQSDWNEKDEGSPAFIINKPTIPTAQVNSDWDATEGVAEILHKPINVSSFSNDTGYVSSDQVETMIFNKIIEMSTVGWKQGNDHYKLVVELIPPPPADTTFILDDGTKETWNISGDLDQQWMVNKGYFNEDDWEWSKTITQANIGTNVINIGSSVFNTCLELTNVVIFAGATNIDGNAFDLCTKLKHVIIPNTVINIGTETFNYCTNLLSITIPEGVINIDDHAFTSCFSLSNVIISDSVTSIGESAFRDCISLTRLKLPSSLTRLGDGVFSGCTSLSSIYIPDGVTSIGAYEFNNCTSLVNLIIPNKVTNIDLYAFADCTSLTNVIIPDSVTSIKFNAFENCTSFTSITIPDNVKDIGAEAFRNCHNMTNITIGAGVTNIWERAFSGCNSLTSIIFEGKHTSNISSMANYPWGITNTSIIHGSLGD